MEFSFKILSLISVSIFKELTAISTLESTLKGAFVVLGLAEDESTKAIPFVILPLAIVDEPCLVDLFAFPVFVAF